MYVYFVGKVFVQILWSLDCSTYCNNSTLVYNPMQTMVTLILVYIQVCGTFQMYVYIQFFWLGYNCLVECSLQEHSIFGFFVDIMVSGMFCQLRC